MDSLLSPWVVMPVIGAFIGWFTNYIAVKMLFHPKQPKRFLGITVQGVFPRRQGALAEKLGAVVAEQLISADDIADNLNSPEIEAKIKERVLTFLDSAIRERLPAAVPMVAMFLSPQLIDTIKSAFASDLDGFIGGTLVQVRETVTSNLDIRELVRAKVAAFSSDRVEDLLVAIMQKEFKFIELVGGVLGAAIGVVQACLV